MWQDRRTASICDDLSDHAPTFLNKTGLVLDAYFSGTKIKWILDSDPTIRQRAEAGELAFGTVDSWLIWKLTNGKVHTTDVTNASRTLIYNIHDLCWDKELLSLLNIPSLLPTVVSSSEKVGETAIKVLGVSSPLAELLETNRLPFLDNYVLNRGCKNTYGTGCFCIMNTGEKA